ITAHKLHGPKGIGALWTRVGIEPVFRGGGQEGGRRGGTQSAPLAWAFAEAVERQLTDAEKVTALRDRLWANVQALLPEIRLTGAPPGPGRLGNNLHFCVPGLPSGPLLNALAAAGLCASAGSACGHGRFSRVLAAIGRQPDDGAFLRLSPGRFTTEDEIDAAAAIVADAVAQLRPVYAR
ncbi:MAG: aminotransferase class V-fold PLP-dependent enzyme, partial [Myxococcales bacterium]|nr:aminotransferase class V-fold PLP-dependent enzyme [Myxococcales bacterium]